MKGSSGDKCCPFIMNELSNECSSQEKKGQPAADKLKRSSASLQYSWAMSTPT